MPPDRETVNRPVSVGVSLAELSVAVMETVLASLSAMVTVAGVTLTVTMLGMLVLLYASLAAHGTSAQVPLIVAALVLFRLTHFCDPHARGEASR